MAPPARSLRTLGLLSCLALLVTGSPAPGTAAPARSVEPETAALDLLERAVRAARTVGYSGTQYVASWSAGASTSTLADVAHDPSSGAVVTALSGSAADGGDPVVVGPTRLDHQVLAVLAGEYDLAVAGSAQCTGRATSVVEARRPGVDGPGAVAGRLWLDRDSGLLLRREVYDDAGRHVRSSAFLDVAIAPASAPSLTTHPTSAAERAQAVSVAAGDGNHAATGLAQLRAHDWQAPERLPRGFALLDVRLRDAGNGSPALAHLTYSDGLSTVSLFAQRGELGAGPQGAFTARPMGGAPVWVHTDSPMRVVWSGGGQVWTLVADAPPEVVEAAVVALPHDPPPGDGLLPRLERGLARLADTLNPFG